jgi:3D (Asp-Asp-Asp) domain-containing protein
MNINFTLFLLSLFIPSQIEKNEIELIKSIEHNKPTIVTATTYKANEGETDSTPNITASGFKIDMKNPRRHRIVAVSRDLKRKWGFGSKVLIKGTGKHDGIYVVRDVMNKRYKKRVDILIGHEDKQKTFKKVEIYKIK